MTSRDMPAAKYRKIESFFKKSNVPVAVGALNSNNSKAADSQADPAGLPTGIQANLEVRLQAESQAEEEENRLDVGTSNEQENVNDAASTSDSTQDNCSIYRGFRMNIILQQCLKFSLQIDGAVECRIATTRRKICFCQV